LEFHSAKNEITSFAGKWVEMEIIMLSEIRETHKVKYFFDLKNFFFSFFFYYSYVHTRLGSFLPPAPTPSLTTHSSPSRSPPQYPAETILPLSLILL
jgi:hypothetical protein